MRMANEGGAEAQPRNAVEMSKHLQREMETLKKAILGLSAEVEENLRRAVRALERRDAQLAKTVIDSDIEIDHLEVDVEEEVLKALALYQPFAADLRFMVSVLKINNDLERIGDLAVNIAERAAYLAVHEKVDLPLDFHGMAEKAQTMLQNALDALVNYDSDLARKVCASDDEIDALNGQIYDQIKEAIPNMLDQLGSLVHMLSIARHLERIGDLATNIAEDVIYMVEGDIIRHRAEDYVAQQAGEEA